jgi:D-xylose 1-dehydrogenase
VLPTNLQQALVQPVHLARMVLFLASDDAAMCTANNYMVEAGSI